MPTMLGATGIGVSDMKRSVHFYTDVLQLGLQPTQTFDVATFTETVLAFPKASKAAGSQIILMQYKDGKVPKNQQGKFVFYVDDVKGAMDRCKAYGSKIFLDLGAGEGWVKEIGMARDPDGFIVEFLPMKMLKQTLGTSVTSKI
ncbi:Glyoxalase/Bleomycin resistance protein/Dihydroxybiphenyl dioxygenase [Microthyrium microscopicum]|uniref:Glyoxalase/Bleomycin resistance protein/Dihydroxybiphenyl dioxygenase n=1 Tax=Microthyrium microscopicum TaxID=703497 RepID=A0A6A6UMF9_9PEZI|nr:Glyoxalase/Bleomycin resistance protein/Dihydroxybiphenyl dioxygenase [Microthyrium microscopicum]